MTKEQKKRLEEIRSRAKMEFADVIGFDTEFLLTLIGEQAAEVERLKDNNRELQRQLDSALEWDTKHSQEDQRLREGNQYVKEQLAAVNGEWKKDQAKIKGLREALELIKKNDGQEGFSSKQAAHCTLAALEGPVVIDQIEKDELKA